MAVPKKKTSPSRKGMRAGGQMAARQPISLSLCSNCGQPKRPHHVCPHCGFYKGRQVLNFSKEKRVED